MITRSSQWSDVCGGGSRAPTQHGGSEDRPGRQLKPRPHDDGRTRRAVAWTCRPGEDLLDSDVDNIRELQLAARTAALGGDAGAIYQLVHDLLDSGTPLDRVLFELLVPIHRDIGRRWQEGDYLISEEHAATAAVETAVSLFTGMLDQPADGRRVVVACAEGDTHSLPARMAAAHLLYSGFRVTFLGTGVVAEDLEEYLAGDPPEALILSCAMVTRLLGARASIQAAHRAGVPVLAGGSAFGTSPELAARIGADAWAPTLPDIEGILELWQPDIAAAEAEAVEPSPELVAFIDAKPNVVATTIANLSADGTAPVNARLRQEVDLLFDAVVGAVLVDSVEALQDFVDWQRVTLAAHGYGPSAPRLVDALKSAVQPAAPGVAGFLGRITTPAV